MTTVRRPAEGSLVDPDDIVEALRAGGHTVGRTRRAILDAVHANEHGFTADELAASLDDVHPSTVYRTLALLEEIGAVHHIHLSHGPAIYERSALSGTLRHLVCERCGRHFSVPARVFQQADRALQRDHRFALDGGHFAIHGRCLDCDEGSPESNP